ncbi:putative terpenoid cyclases/protein prenyltransferase alpha-alpha toroid [Helianthus annuus]|nr:putative terpenoid cyclases/protein prenyltransferase alpha-alpha toroid [Helianthus annuus]
MFRSALSYIALRLLGEGPMMEMVRWTEPGSGYLTMVVQPQFPLGARLISRLQSTSPEFWLFPEAWPFHPAKMWCYCRTTYMPMSYLYGRKFHGPITDLVLQLRQEILPIPYHEINWNKQRHNCCKVVRNTWFFTGVYKY